MDKSCEESGMEEILAKQRAAFLLEGPPSIEKRRASLKRLRNAILAHRDHIETAISADFGHRSRHETAIMEVLPVVRGINYLHKNLRRFMAHDRRHVSLISRFGSARVEYQPVGVVGIMSPWNYPLSLSIMPAATAIAAGNRVIIKPSEFSPAMSALLGEILSNCLPKEQIAIVTGDATQGAAFSALPFDHLVFTGSTSVGRLVMKAASDQLVPVTLELGGKSPVIVGKDYPLDRAAAAIAYGKLANAGQTCIAPDYALVHETRIDSFITAYQQAVRKLYPSGPASDDYTSIVNERHFARLKTLMDDAQAKGARIIDIGHRPEDAGTRSHTLAPAIVLGITDDMAIAQDEIFGPLLPVLPYRTVDDAIAFINARPRPLSLYYFGADDDDRRRVLSRTISGNVTINGTLLHFVQDDLPFGGVGASGIGAYHAIEGFRALSHAKGVFVQGRWSAPNLLRAPFRRLADATLKMMLR